MSNPMYPPPPYPPQPGAPQQPAYPQPAMPQAPYQPPAQPAYGQPPYQPPPAQPAYQPPPQGPAPHTQPPYMQPGYGQPQSGYGPPQGYAPQPPAGYAPQPPQGYAPQQPAGYDPYAGVQDATMSMQNPFFLDGTYDVEVIRVCDRMGGYKGNSFIIEGLVLASSNPERPPGTMCTQVIKLGTNQMANQMALGNINNFVAAGFGLDTTKKEDAERVKREITNDVVKRVVSDQNPLARQRLRLDCASRGTRPTPQKPEGGVFTQHRWSPITAQTPPVPAPAAAAPRPAQPAHPGPQPQGPMPPAPQGQPWPPQPQAPAPAWPPQGPSPAMASQGQPQAPQGQPYNPQPPWPPR